MGTFNGASLTKKCMNLFGRKLCLCQFIGFLEGQKHVCHPERAKKIKAMQSKMKKLQIKKKKLKAKKRAQRMKRLKKIAALKKKKAAVEARRIKHEEERLEQENHVLRGENKVNKKMKQMMKKYRMKIKRLKKKLRKKRKQWGIHGKHHHGHGHGHGHGHHHGRRGRNHPHHHRHFHLHQHPHVPWKKYRKHAKHMPGKRPKWVPKWIWRELKENYKAMEEEDNMYGDAREEEEGDYLMNDDENANGKEYYDYYQYLKDYYDDQMYDELEREQERMYPGHELPAAISSAWSGMDNVDDEYDDYYNEYYDDDDFDDESYDDYDYDDGYGYGYDESYDDDNDYALYDDDWYNDYESYDDDDEDYAYGAYGSYGTFGDYGYDDDEEENAISFADLQDEWVDEQDGSAWIVSKDAVQDYDLQWENDEEWDEVASQITTSGGNTLTRKCLHMWGQRLCLCQFLDWMDSHKYKCTQSVVGVITPSTRGVMS